LTIVISLAQGVLIYVLLECRVISWGLGEVHIYIRAATSKGMLVGKRGKLSLLETKGNMAFKGVLRGVEGGSSLGVGLGIDSRSNRF
jgi:hypothetical protein